MTTRERLFQLTIATLLLSGSHLSIASPPSIFSQCLEKHLAASEKDKEISNKKEIAKKLRQAQDLCRKRMSSSPRKNIKLPETAIGNLQIEAGFGWGIFSGSIYNANKDITITKLIVSMVPVHGPHMHHTDMSQEPREYVIETNLLPLSKSALSVALTKKDAPIHEFEWGITQAFGYKLP